MSKNVATIRGTEYPVQPVSKVYFRGLTECLTDLGDVDFLSKSAKTIKKVLIPTIPDSIICKGDLDEEFYLWSESVEPEEITEIILKIARCYRLQKLEKAKLDGNSEEVKEHEEGLRIINQYLEPQDTVTIDIPPPTVSEIEQLKAEIKALKGE